MATAKRRREEPDDDGFTLVQRERFRVKRPPSPQQSGATASERPIPLVRWLESELQFALKVDVSASGEFLLRGATWDAAATFQKVADGQPRGIVLARREPSRRGVLVGYPTGLPLDPVLESPLVETAVRCSYNAGLNRHLPTRQVQLTLRGHVPAALDLGCFGTFAVRRFIQEPVRCYRCQAFGHYQRQCQRRQELCGVCSGEHASGTASAAYGRVGSGPWLGAPTAVLPSIMLGTAVALPGSGRLLGPRYLASCSGRRLPCSTSVSTPAPPLHGLKTPPRPDGPAAGGGRRGPGVSLCCPLWGIWTWTPRPPCCRRTRPPWRWRPLAGCWILLWPPAMTPRPNAARFPLWSRMGRK
ncbi:hypothetical protein GWK47_045584 [Chionoecetes opilio]|uniref:CCHC-type domain-containing protein n=1 Tax=Chionoecetes opilio TaxID=41210 RepID=A0A8J5CWT2_CHIOP|nr:hypothetical protein GWK47_045584 [Chionoecetes opilio]